MGNEESKSIHAKKEKSTSKEALNKDDLNMDFESLPPTISKNLQKSDHSSIQIQKDTSKSHISENKNSMSNNQSHPSRMQIIGENSFSSLSEKQTSAQNSASHNSLEPTSAQNSASHNSLTIRRSSDFEDTSEGRKDHDEAKLGRSRHPNVILPEVEVGTGYRNPSRKFKPKKHILEYMYNNNISEELYKVTDSYLWTSDQAWYSNKQFSVPTSIQGVDGNHKNTFFETRPNKNHSCFASESSRPWKQFSAMDDVKYICEIHKTTSKPDVPQYEKSGETSRTILDGKLRWTHDSERQDGINQANIFGKRTDENRTDEIRTFEAKWNTVDVHASNPNILKETLFSNCATPTLFQRSFPQFSNIEEGNENLSMSISESEKMYSAKRKYALKSKKDNKFSLRLLHVDNENDGNLKFGNFYHKAISCQLLLNDGHGKLQFDSHLARSLIRDLIHFNNFQADLATLCTRHGKNPRELISILKDNAGIFSLMVHSSTSATVRLRPKIRYCSDRILTRCKKIFCFAVHVCPYYIFDACRVKGCQFGHALRTTKSSYIFKSFYLDYFSEYVLKAILRIIWAGAICPKLCFAYNNGTCTAHNCMDLHLCYKHVMSLGLCPGIHTYCSYNHDIYDTHCKRIFKYFNISTNATPRDLMKYLMYSMKNIKTTPYYSQAYSQAIDKNVVGYKAIEHFETLV